jgi:hypothetical protein
MTTSASTRSGRSVARRSIASRPEAHRLDADVGLAERELDDLADGDAVVGEEDGPPHGEPPSRQPSGAG